MVSVFLAAPYAFANPMVSIFPGISFNDGVMKVSAVLELRCNGLETIQVEQPFIPLAEYSESHLVCSEYRTPSGTTIELVSFSFGDDQLKFLAARGGAVEILTSASESEPFSLAGVEGYIEDLMAVSHEDDTVWLGVMGALRTYVFLWENPYLSHQSRSSDKFDDSVAIPDILRFGDSIEKHTDTFTKECQLMELIERETVQLLNNPETETQLNCYGYVYGGFIRTIEAVFGDGILEKAWIITAKEEESRISDSLTQIFGERDFVSSEYESFNNWRVALRKDEPEVLLLSESLAELYKLNFQP